MFSKSEADRILKRAAEIERSDEGNPLSEDELRSIASEAGFGRRALERAIAEARRLSTHRLPPEPVQRSGLIVHRISVSRTVPFELNYDQLMYAIRLFQPYRDGSARIRLEDDCINWRDGKGISFTLWSGGGVTEAQVFSSRFMSIRRGRWVAWVKAAADRLEALLLLLGPGMLNSAPSLDGRGETEALTAPQ